MKIDTYILTGFLGAGKTTILNELLKLFPHNTGIIENEFGSVNIDGSLIVGKFNEIYELTNGCICCSLDNELYTTLHQIVKNNHSIQNLFIETTGIADVGNIASLLKKQDVSEYFKLKSIICVVDCEQILDQINEVNDKDLYFKVKIKQTWLGKILEYIYKTPNLQINFNTMDGDNEEFRFIPKMFENWTLMSPLISNNLEFAKYHTNNYSQKNIVTSFRIGETKKYYWFWKPEIKIDFMKMDYT